MSFTIGTLLQLVAGLTGVSTGFSFFLAYRDTDLVEAMHDTPTSAIGEVTSSGYYEIKGKAKSLHPLLAPKTQEEVLFYRYVQREEWVTRRKRRTYHHQATLKDSTEAVPFALEDETGLILIDPKGARLEGKLLSQSDEGTNEVEKLLGAVSFQMGPNGVHETRQEYRLIHEIYGAKEGDQLYVIGPTIADSSGDIRFGKQASEERPFLISSRTEEDLSKKLGERSALHSLVSWSIAVLFLGLVLALFLLPAETLNVDLFPVRSH
jgi:hypothetical protein